MDMNATNISSSQSEKNNAHQHPHFIQIIHINNELWLQYYTVQYSVD